MPNPARDTDALSAWLDGELTDAEAAELEAELQRDPELRAELEELESVVQRLREDGPVGAPADFHAGVMARIEREHPVARFSFSGWFSSRWESFAIGFAAVAALLLVLPVGLTLRKAPEAPEQTSPAVAAPRSTPGVADQGLGGGEEPAVVAGRPEAGAKGQASTPPEEPTKVATGAPQVIGKASTAASGGEAAAPAGTSEEVATSVGPPIPDVTVSAGLDGEDATWRTVVRSEDPNLKRKVLSVAARYGNVQGPEGEVVASGAMSSSREQLVVTLDQAKLAAFQQELLGMGLTVESQKPEGLLAAGPVELRLTLQLVGGGGTPEVDKVMPAARAAADEMSEPLDADLSK